MHGAADCVIMTQLLSEAQEQLSAPRRGFALGSPRRKKDLFEQAESPNLNGSFVTSVVSELQTKSS